MNCLVLDLHQGANILFFLVIALVPCLLELSAASFKKETAFEIATVKMIFRLASLLTVVTFLQLLSFSIKIANVSKYYTHYVSTTVWDAVHGSEAQEYDFIVVGSGSAGSVVANRLSRHNRVLLIEAGGTPFYADSLPILAGDMLHRPETDYMYKTVPQKHSSKGMIEKRSFWPRGRMLGGSSNLNYMMYVKAHPYDYDNWANLTKDDSWSYKNLLPYFKRSINYNGRFKSDDLTYGYLYGTHNVESHGPNPMYDLFMEGGKELGFDVDIDLNGPQRTGFGPGEFSQKQGKRETSYTAFIEPILDRDNLVISKYSQAIKLQMDKSNKVVGIWYVQHGKKKFASASKEVVVSAGAVDSPKLLMLSGIGRKEDLKKLGIKPKIDLPVGQNLKDHVMTFLLPFTINSTSYSYRPDRDLGITDLINYYWHGTGPFGKTLGSMAQSFFTSSLTKKSGLDWTDFQMIIINSGPYDGVVTDMSNFIKIRQDILQRLVGNAVKEGQDGFMIALTLGRPKSVGTITLKNKDPSSHPIIDPNYLSHPDDMSRYVEAVRFLLKVVEETKAFQKINATYVDFPIDDCKQHKFRSDKYWECYLRHISMTMYHPVSTCKMGSGPNDKTSVVDSKLRVLHTRGLRISDCSIVPELMNGNTNAPALMIGEKGADIIRDHWSKQYSVCLKMEIFSKKWSHTLKCFYSRMV